MNLNLKEKLKFSYHAMQRARERKLWKYVNKKLLYFEGIYMDTHRARVGDCVYALEKLGERTVVTTMYRRVT